VLKSISHLALVVKDPQRTAALFQLLFAAEALERTDDDGHLETFMKLGGAWFVFVRAPVERTRTGDHIAFSTTREALEATATKLQAMGHEFIRARDDRALYFFDYDNHVFELDTEDLEQTLRGSSSTKSQG
jgi:catechol 2,3-dioxygenase-like lactoylglutathione lyase family enzyme